jgi:hypothetical protein
MKNLTKFGIAILLLVMMIILQRTSAMPHDGSAIATNSARLYMPGLPYVSQVQLIKGNPTGGFVYESGPTFTTPMIIDWILAVVLVGLSYLGIARLIDNKLKLSLIQLLIFTSAIGLSIAFCLSTTDVFLGDNRLKMGDQTLEFTNDQRPPLQRIVYGGYLALGIFGISALLAGKRVKIHEPDSPDNNTMHAKPDLHS